MSHIVKGNKVSGWDNLKNPGDWMFYEDFKGIVYMCPTGCGVIGSIPFIPYDNHPHWNWDGNRETPTLTPSIQKLDGCKWHGFLTKGEWVGD